MEAKIFSNSLEIYTGGINNERLLESLTYLSEIQGNNYKVLHWDDNHLAVPFELSVDLPTLGTDNNIDIRESEPVVLVFNKNHYPYKAPTVYTDRIDFPKDSLSHLFIAKNGRPPAFCFIKGNRDDWYATKRIQDLIIRVGNWLRDAASGRLVENGDKFDPLRLESYESVIIYDYDLIAKIVQSNQTILPDLNFAIGLFESSPAGGFNLVKILDADNVKECLDEIKNDLKRVSDDPLRKLYRFGYFLWSDNDEKFSIYNIDFPESWVEFKNFCKQYNIEFEKFEDFYISDDISNYIIFPVVIALKRPKQVIGFSSNLEFLNFLFSIDSKDIVDGKILDTVKVKLSSHNQPLTVEKAIAISGLERNDKFAMVFGCGALGSKIVMHLARGGNTQFFLNDPDDLSPHNLVRHALLPGYEGKNKAKALSEVIAKLYPGKEVITEGFPSPDIFFKLGGDFFKVLPWIFDFSASESFFLKIVNSSEFDGTKVINAHISDFGNLGVLLREGNERNPRIDDLKILLYNSYKDIPEVKEWLSREKDAATNTNLTVTVGVGCNSETTILADDKVSLHSAFFARAIVNEMKNLNSEPGKIILSIIQDEPEFSIQSKTLHILPLNIYHAKNDPSWSIRFKHGIVDKIKTETKRAGNFETGGVFVGVVNYKSKTIHVTDLIPAPPDSKANHVCFLRGFEGLKDTIEEIFNGSGGHLGYVGEWHSHPRGPNAPSKTDLESVEKFKKEFKDSIIPLPVFLTIVTQDDILTYVF